MATIEELCAMVEECCGTPSDSLFKRTVVAALCQLASASYDTESEAFACAYDGDQNPAGWVFLTTVDEVGDDDPAAEVGHSLKLVQLDGSVIMDYDPAAEGHVLGKCVTGGPLLWTQCMEDDNGKFTRVFIKDPVADTTRFQDHVHESGEDYTPVGEIFPCEIDVAVEKCMKSKQAGEFTSDFLAIEDAVPGSSDPVSATIDGPMDGIFATIEMQNGTTWGSGTSGGQIVTGVKIPDQTGSATVSFDFPDACEGVIDVTRTRLMFWDLDGDGGNVNQEFVEFEVPFARVSDNLLIMNAPTNTIVGGFPGANAEHNWVEWDGLVDSIHLKRDPEVGLGPRGNILLEGIEVSATVIALYTGVQEPDGSWKYFDYQGNELTDPILVSRLRPCDETICTSAGVDIETEPGCLTGNGSVNIDDLNSCNVFGVELDGERIQLDLTAGWTKEQLVDAVNAVEPDSLAFVDGNLVAGTGGSLSTFAVLCVETEWIEWDTTASGGIVNQGPTMTGTFPLSGITAEYNSNSDIFTQNNIYQHANFPTVFDVPNGTTQDIIRNTEITTNELTFSAPIANPTVVFASVGSPILTVGVNLSEVIDVTFQQDVPTVTSMGFTGREGFVIAQVQDAASTGFTFDYTVAETYANFIIGRSETIRQEYLLTPSGPYRSVEIVKVFDTSDNSFNVRVFSPDGETEYARNDDGTYGDENLNLNVGDCATLAALTQEGEPLSVELSESDEVVVLCDDNGSFLRRITNDGEGVVTVSDTALDGTTAYAPVGTVTVCTAETVEQELPESDEVLVLCDDNGSFFRRVTNDGEGGITITDTALDGTTAYTTSGTVTNCSVSSSDVEQEVLCAEGERFVRHTEYQNGAVVNTFDTTLDMTTPISVTEAAVERCQPRDVEVIVMCEADGTRFLRHITRDLYDNQVSVRDTDVDGVTSYTATGNEEPCGCQEVDWVKELCDVIITPITIPALLANGENLSNRQVTFTDGDYTISARAQETISLTAIGIFVGILGDRISLSGIPASATNIEMGIERWQVSEGEALAAFTENVTVVSGGYTSSGTTITATADGTNAGVVGLPDGTTDFSFEIFRTNEVGSGAITSISFDIPLPTKFQRRFTIACDGSLTTKDYTCDGADYTVEGDVVCCDVEGNSCENPVFTKSSESWTEKLCDVETEIVALDVYTIDTDTDEVFKYDGISNTVIDSFTPPGAVNYAPASAYDAGSDTYYTYDLNAGEWHSYVGSNIGAGYTNLGSFAGPSITSLNFGAIDPTTGLGHFGTSNTSRYVVDFQAATVTALPLASVAPSSLAITDDGTAYVGSPAGTIGTIDLVTGVGTLPNSIAPAVANGLSVDNTGNNLGFFATDANGSQLYRWTEPDASDVSLVGTFPASGTLDVGQAELNITTTEFIRHYEKECSGNVVYTDYDNEGQLYTSSGDVQVCTVTEDTVSAATVTGTLTSVATAGAQASPAGAQEVSFANVGTADALVAGATLPAGATVTYTGYFDNAANTYNRLAPITYDAQTSTLLVSVTP